MKISVVIPTYNEEDVILACLESLDNQTAGDFEVIVVDDGSTDSTVKRISEYEPNRYRLTLLRVKHKGPGAARNAGVKRTKGEILVFVDADMTFNKDFLKELTAPIVNGNEKGTFSKNEFVSNWDNTWARCWNTNEGWEKKKRHPTNYPNRQKVFRAILKSEFDAVEGFTPGGYTDDWSLSEKLGYLAVAVLGAKFYHKNPDNLDEVFHHAIWVGKRSYKLGFLGYIAALVRSSLPVSILIGVYKSIVNRKSDFWIFKIVFDLGIFLGIISFIISEKASK
jgi:glycosyltransferase involved in cell wall biosynthesis